MTEIYFSQFWRLESPIPSFQPIQFLVRVLFSGLQTAAFSLCPHLTEREMALVTLLIRALALSDEALTLMTSFNFYLLFMVPTVTL